MKKFIRRVIKSFKKLTDANLFTFGQNVTASMAAAVATFPTPVPSQQILMPSLPITESCCKLQPTGIRCRCN
jgi:hypothetical protein